MQSDVPQLEVTAPGLERLNELEQKKAGLQGKLEAWEKTLDQYRHQMVHGSSTCDATELLKEKIRNLEGMMMGCQQEIVTLGSSIEQEEQVLELQKKISTFETDSPVKASNSPTQQKSFLFQNKDTLPGMTFFENVRSVTINAEEMKLDFEEELGISLSIPGNSIDEEQNVEIFIIPAFSGPYAGHEDFEPVSPAYLIKSNKEVKFRKDVTVRIQHNARQVITEDLVIMRASSIPLYRGPLFSPLYVFHEMEKSKVKFFDGGQFGEVKTNQFSMFMIWRKLWRRVKGKDSEEELERCETGKLYSARLYKGDPNFKNRAVFCMCQDLPQYTEYCNKVMVEEYAKYGITCNEDGKIDQGALSIIDDTVFLEGESQQCSVEMDQKIICKTDIDVALIMNQDVSSFSNYPPRSMIYLVNPNPEPWTLHLAGLTDEVVFNIVPLVQKEEATSKTADMLEPSSKALLILKWRDKEGHKRSFRLVDKVSAKWREFAAILGVSEKNLDEWEEQYSKKAHKCWQKVMKYWLKGAGDSDQYPPTWVGLYTLLGAAQCDEIAKQLEDAVESVKCTISC